MNCKIVWYILANGGGKQSVMITAWRVAVILRQSLMKVNFKIHFKIVTITTTFGNIIALISKKERRIFWYSVSLRCDATMKQMGILWNYGSLVKTWIMLGKMVLTAILINRRQIYFSITYNKSVGSALKNKLSGRLPKPYCFIWTHISLLITRHELDQIKQRRTFSESADQKISELMIQ